MSEVYQCSICMPVCIIVAGDDEIPSQCPFVCHEYEAEWRQIS